MLGWSPPWLACWRWVACEREQRASCTKGRRPRDWQPSAGARGLQVCKLITGDEDGDERGGSFGTLAAISLLCQISLLLTRPASKVFMGLPVCWSAWSVY